MKLTLALAIALTLSAPVLQADGGADYKPVSRNVSETFTSKVVRVYAFKEGSSSYASYVVNWKDHEVVVHAGPFEGDKVYQVGETVRCIMQQMSPRPGESTGRIHFLIIPDADNPEVNRRIKSFLSENEALTRPGRIEAMGAEMARRRALREAALEAIRERRADADASISAAPVEDRKK